MKNLFHIGHQAKNFFKRGQPIVLAAMMLTAVAVGGMPAVAHAQNLTENARISLTFDDGLQSAIAKAAPVLKAHGLTGTNYVITDCVGMTTTPNTCVADTAKPYMTWAQITQLHQEFGWEIGSHTATHPQLATEGLTDAQLKTQLEGSKTTLAQHGFDAKALAFPYGDYNNNVLAQAAKYYSSARGFADTDSPNAFPYNDALLFDQQVQTGAPAPTWSMCTDTTVAGVKTCIDNAIAKKQWLILTFHNITDTPEANAESYDFSTSDLDQIAAYVQAKQAAGTMKSVNISDGLVTGANNLLTGGSFTSATALGTFATKPSATEWTTTSAGITVDTATNGNYPEAKNAVKIAAGAAAAHLYSPMVPVSSTQSYVLKNFANVTAYTSGELGYYIHEYDAAGTEIPGQWKKAVTALSVTNSGFTYTPSSTAVATASLEVYVLANSGITAYVDNFQWYSTTETTTPPPAGDTTAPVVSNVTVSGQTVNSATISWTTDEATTGTVSYGTTTSYGQTATSSILGTTHSVTLTGLTASTNYSYQLVAKDAANNVSTASTGSFGTTATGVVLLGDLDGNGSVNGIDLSTLLGNWNTTIPSITPLLGDLNNDGYVNGIDLSTLLGNWSNQ